MRFRLSPGSSEPIFAQLVRQVRAGVASGKLRPGERLPAVRAMARELVINPNTVQKAYTQLERDGMIQVRRGTGTFVADQPPPPVSRTVARKRLLPILETLVAEATHLGLSQDALIEEMARTARRFKMPGARRRA